MLKYFAEHRDLEQVKSIFAALNRTKDRLQRGEYSAPLQDFDNCKHLFDDIKALAIQNKDERLANAQYVFREYFLLFCELMKYWERLKSKDYQSSWNKLQDCFDIIKYVGKFTDEDNRYELAKLYDLLLEYEALYPYKVFCSSEYIIEEANCSICGKSVLGLDCPHIKGELYCVAEHIVPLQAIEVEIAIRIHHDGAHNLAVVIGVGERPLGVLQFDKKRRTTGRKRPFDRPEDGATHGVADQILVRVGTPHDGRNECIVFQSHQLDHVKILGDFHRRGKRHNADRQQPPSVGLDRPTQAAEQHGHQHVPHKRTNETIPHEQTDVDFYQKQ